MNMKNLVLLLMINFLLVADTCLGQTGQFSIESAPQQMPLRGDAAIDTLKRSGQYDSLMEAISAARADEIPADDAFTQQAKLNNPEPAQADYFGNSVAISGDTVIVGASRDDGTFGADEGSAYVFVRSGTIWSQRAKLTASDAAANDTFGNHVAISGNTVVVGAYLDDGAFLDQGSAYVFVGSGATWSQQAKLENPEPAASDRYSLSSVAISGDTAVVGAEADDGTFTDQGSAYVFVRSGAAWSLQAKLDNPEPAAADRYGNSVTISGDTVIVGNNHDNGTFFIQGSAYVFVRSGAAWTQQSKLTASDAALGDNFGYSVAISGNTAIVGAYSDNDTFVDQGSAYVFQNPAPTAAYVSVGGRVSDSNGRAVSMVRVTITDTASGETRTALTSSFGYFRFEGILTGRSYRLEAAHKRYQFAPRFLNVSNEITDADLIAEP